MLLENCHLGSSRDLRFVPFFVENAKLVDLEDGCCRECEGQLEITHFDDACLFVLCTACDADYEVETDFFGDGCVKYYYTMQCKSLGLDPNDMHQ